MTFTLRRILSVLTACVVSSGAAAVIAAPADAVPAALQFTFIQYDSPGGDTRSNPSLNKEYVQITNRGSVVINIGGFALWDTSQHKYLFPSYVVGKGKTVFVHTGRGTNGINPFTGKPDSTRLYWGSRAYVWNNTGDTATLRTATRVYDTCKWIKIGNGYTTC